MPRVANAQPVATSAAPVTLRALLTAMRRDYPAMRAAASRVQAANAARLSSRAFGNPVLSYQTDQTPFPGGRPLVGVERETMVTATFPLEALYQRGPRIQRGNAEFRAAQADAMATRQHIALDAANAFYRAADAQVRAETNRDLEGWLDSVVNYNRARVQEGAAAEADLIRATVERDRISLEGDLQSAELLQARAMLLVYLPASSNPGRNFAIAVDDAPYLLPAHVTPAAAAANAFIDSTRNLTGTRTETRAEVRAARERVNAKSATVNAERSMVFRQLGATIGTMQSGRTTSMIAGVSMPLPLFDHNNGEVQRARAERDAAQFDLATVERSATADYTGAYDAAALLTERVRRFTARDSTNLLARADESRRIALGAYREGAVSLLQVLDAARAWADARQMYYRAVFAQQQSILTLLVTEGVDLFSTLPTLTIPAGNK